MPDDINPILARWNRHKSTAFGRWFASRLVGFKAPYTGTIRARIEHLEKGSIELSMRDRRVVRNHLESIHAAALLNLTELTGGLLATASIPADARMIITRVELDFVKKARGTVRSHGRCIPPATNQRDDLVTEVTIRDGEGNEVASGRVTTLIGPRAGGP
jgi:acyl-coenzyme A thioesterase PaaI-like protein